MRYHTKKTGLFITIAFLPLYAGLVSFSRQNTAFCNHPSFKNDFLHAEPANIVQDVLDQTNQFRLSEALPVLTDSKELNEIAQKHSENMASGRVGFGHDGFEERNELAKKKIKMLYSFAENVAYGSKTGEEVVTMWKKSPPHRRNMLGKYKYIGIGVAKDSKGTIFFTQIFVG